MLFGSVGIHSNFVCFRTDWKGDSSAIECYKKGFWNWCLPILNKILIGLERGAREMIELMMCQWVLSSHSPFNSFIRISCHVFSCRDQWGTWKSGVSLVNTGIRHPSSVMKNVIPIVMAGVIGIYGLIISVILAESIPKPNDQRQNTYSIYTGMAHVS